MYKFNNTAYESLIEDLISDAFYLEGHSLRGRISTIRQYTEIVVRRIINFPEGKRFTLGQRNVEEQLKNKNDYRLIDAVEKINNLGSKHTHTEILGSPTESEFNDVLDALLYLYSYMFIEFFERYEFGKQPQINSAFSTLPPIIRYITLDSLYNKNSNNIYVIDKLVLSTIKAFDDIKAFEWVDEKREVLEKTSSIAESAIPGIVEKYGKTIADEIIAGAPNMYCLCIDKINKMKELIEKKGKLYEDFEGAINYYKNFGIVEGTSSEVKEFNSILEFLYLGRKPKPN